MILSVANLHFQYNSRPVLEDVTLHVDRGEILVVLGVNGAGKSTLLKCINRILKPSRGVVLVEGRDLRHMRAKDLARRFGYVPQKQSEGPLSVFEAVLLGRRPHIRWAASERDYEVVEKVLGLLQLGDLSLRSLDSLSGGEIQKVLLARALAQEPDVLLLDEPTSNLDLKNQLEVLHLISRAVREQGLSAIVSIHDLNLALRLGDAFLLLRDGRVHAIAPREGLTRETIREVYGVEVALGEVAGYPVVVMLDTESAGSKRKGKAGS